jgi:hypothetical protein
MKTTYLLAAFCLFAFASCKTAYFNNANQLHNVQGTVYLTNGEKISGKMSVQLNNQKTSLKARHTLAIQSNGQVVAIAVGQIEGYECNNEFYALKQLPKGTRKEWAFVKEVTAPNASLKLYAAPNIGKDKNGTTFQHQAYYIGMQQDAELTLWAFNGYQPAPIFSEKMTTALTGCPILADKVAQKEKEYDYAASDISKEKRLQVLKKIIDEYNFCEKAIAFGVMSNNSLLHNNLIR